MPRLTIHVIVWLGLAAGLWWLFQQAIQPNTLNSQGEQSTVTLKRGSDGHYRAEAYINGQVMPVLIDTGATGVAIPAHIAEKLHLPRQGAARMQTANGTTLSYLTRLESIRLGGIETHDVAAIITPNLQGDILLGMSFLSRMDVRLYRGEMTIKPAL